MKLLWALLPFCVMACVTSSELAEKDNYVDPTNVATVELPNPAVQARSSESIERDYDVLKGRYEESEYKLRQMEEENKRLSEELAKSKAAPVATAPVSTAQSDVPPQALLGSGGGSAEAKKGSASNLWALAQDDIKEGRYKESISPLSEIIKNYPKDPHAYYAALAIAMVQYRIENFKDAALNFNQIIDKYAKRPETSIAWFGQGAVFFKMGQKEDSRLFYEETAKRYPKSEAAVVAKKLAASRKGGAPRDLFLTFPQWSAKSPK